MKINLNTGHLFTDRGSLLKQMSCPLGESWDDMTPESQADRRTCSQCSRRVTDISLRSDEEVSNILADDPEACFYIDLNNPNSNIKVIAHEI